MPTSRFPVAPEVLECVLGVITFRIARLELVTAATQPNGGCGEAELALCGVEQFPGREDVIVKVVIPEADNFDRIAHGVALELRAG